MHNAIAFIFKMKRKHATLSKSFCINIQKIHTSIVHNGVIKSMYVQGGGPSISTTKKKKNKDSLCC